MHWWIHQTLWLRSGQNIPVDWKALGLLFRSRSVFAHHNFLLRQNQVLYSGVLWYRPWVYRQSSTIRWLNGRRWNDRLYGSALEEFTIRIKKRPIQMKDKENFNRNLDFSNVISALVLTAWTVQQLIPTVAHLQCWTKFSFCCCRCFSYFYL